jgi:hypothetical protein
MKTIDAFLKEQESSRKELLTAIHKIIISTDKNVTPVVANMMGKEMILYNCGAMKYALSSVKAHMSLHVMPIYGSSPLHAKYQKLLPDASFQKGCINFKQSDQIPLPVVKDLVTDCAKVDLNAMLQKMRKPASRKK